MRRSPHAIGAFLIQPGGYRLVERHAPGWLVDGDVGTHEPLRSLRLRPPVRLLIWLIDAD
jgi:hypothetical protein